MICPSEPIRYPAQSNKGHYEAELVQRRIDLVRVLLAPAIDVRATGGQFEIGTDW
ncbi:hypothetical protein [Streptomyces sp. NPDC056549]|uniref:hypothetical protein n=1 Tax=Streptomyces sp. NPDC056549 TaxID=3345864 RepID=UPI003680FFD9